MRVAASIWRDPTVLPSWNTTEQGLNEELALHNDNCIILDDTQQGAAAGRDKISEFMSVTHRVTHGSTRRRSKAVSSSLPTFTAKAILLSSSPELVASIKSNHGGNTDDGDRARFLEIQIHHGNQGGIWAGVDLDILQANSFRELSERLSNAAKNNYGKIGKVWIKYLMRYQASLEAKIVKLTSKFLEQLKLNKTDSVKARIAQKIALIYAAGVIAIKADILPWKKSQVLRAANNAYKNIIKNAFPKSASESKAWEIFCAALSDPSKFIIHTSPSLKNVNYNQNICGVIYENNKQILVNRDSLLELFDLNGQDKDKLLQELLTKLEGLTALQKGDSGKLTKSIRIGPNGTKFRFIVLDKNKILNR